MRYKFRFGLSALVIGFSFIGSSILWAQSAQQAVSSGEPAASDTASDVGFLFDGGSPKTLADLQAMETKSNALATELIPAIVNVRVGAAQGTGVVVTRDGYILTAAHVIGRPGLEAEVVFPDGKKAKAKTLGLNAGFDSGMMKIDEPGTWPYVDIGESDSLKQGQWLVAIGHPGGMDEKRGLVTRVGRLLVSSPQVMRTDCVLVGGDSGGPLFDFDGRLIGIHSRIGGSLWENFHVPIDAFSGEWDQLAEGKQVGRPPMPYVGLNFVDSTNKVLNVPEGGPAEKAGVKADDIVIKLGDTEIKSKRDFASAFAKLKIGDKTKIRVQRGDEELDLDLEVGQD